MLLISSNLVLMISGIPCDQAVSTTRPETLARGILTLWLRSSVGGSFGRNRRSDGADHHGRHLELRGAIPDVVTLGDPFEIGPDRPNVAIVVLGQQQPHRP